MLMESFLFVKCRANYLYDGCNPFFDEDFAS